MLRKDYKNNEKPFFLNSQTKIEWVEIAWSISSQI